MASIDKQASRIARASLTVAPIIPPLPSGLIRNQNQVLSRLQITKSTPKWRLRSDEPALTTRTPSIHLRRHRIGPPKAGYLGVSLGHAYIRKFETEQGWVTSDILMRSVTAFSRNV